MVTIFVVGSIATFVVAWLLLVNGHWAAAAGVIEVSPFPCPPGMPC